MAFGDPHTAKSAFRGRKLKKAFGLISRKVQRGWVESTPTGPVRIETPDEWFARTLGLEIRDGRLIIPGWLQRTPRAKGRSGCSPLFLALDAVAHEPDPVVEILIKGQRQVFIHSFPTRLLQRAWLLTVGSLIEERLSALVFGYRKRLCRFDALQVAPRVLGSGRRYAAKLDIRKCFETIRPAHVEAALANELPQVQGDLRDLGIRFLACSIHRRPDHPHRRSGQAPRYEWTNHKDGTFPRYIDSHKRPMQAVQKELGLPLLSHHKLGRHSVGSQAATAGVSLKVIQRQLGHRSPQSTHVSAAA